MLYVTIIVFFPFNTFHVTSIHSWHCMRMHVTTYAAWINLDFQRVGKLTSLDFSAPSNHGNQILSTLVPCWHALDFAPLFEDSQDDVGPCKACGSNLQKSSETSFDSWPTQLIGWIRGEQPWELYLVQGYGGSSFRVNGFTLHRFWADPFLCFYFHSLAFRLHNCCVVR